MEHVFFARFGRPEDARRFLRDLRASDRFRSVGIDVVGSELARSSQDMPRGLSNVPAAALKGIVGGGLGGLVFGVILGLLGLAPVAVTALASALLGALAGTLGAVLIGAQDPDQNLEKAVASMGPAEVILGLHAPDVSIEEGVADVVRRDGGEIVPRAGSPLEGGAVERDDEG